MRVVKMITDDGGEKYDNNYWHIIDVWHDAHRVFCDGHVFGFGESQAKFTTKEGKVTCPDCIKIIKDIKLIKL